MKGQVNSYAPPIADVSKLSTICCRLTPLPQPRSLPRWTAHSPPHLADAACAQPCVIPAMRHRFGRPIAIAKAVGGRRLQPSPRSLAWRMGRGAGPVRCPPPMPPAPGSGAISAGAVAARWPIAPYGFRVRRIFMPPVWMTRWCINQRNTASLPRLYHGFFWPTCCPGDDAVSRHGSL